MTTVDSHAQPVHQRHLPRDPFEGAHRVVLEQVETFRAPAHFVLPSLDQVDPEINSGPLEQARIARDCYDTDGLALARAGVTVQRDRDEDVWIVTMAEVSSVGESIRREVSYVGSRDAVPADLRRLLEPQLHGKSITRVAQLSTQRVVTPLINRSGVRIADVIDERTVATPVTGTSDQFRVIDVQVRDLDGVGHKLIGELDTLLTGAGCSREPRITAYARAFGASKRTGR